MGETTVDFQTEQLVHGLIMKILVRERSEFQREARQRNTTVEHICTAAICEALRCPGGNEILVNPRLN